MLRDLSAVTGLVQCGSGTFGMVFKGVDRETGNKVALKKLKMEKEHQGFPITAIREIKILKALKYKHPNIVNLHEIVTCNSDDDNDSRFKKDDVFLVFEYIEFDLAGLLDSEDAHITNEHIRSYTKQLLDGVSYMHKQRILHRDLKSANILISSDNILKICDWV
jgi:serine/threonine protein kinase